MTIGIAADDYKVMKFKAELIKGSFSNFNVASLSPGVTLISVTIEQSELPKLTQLVKETESHFKAQKN